MAERENQENTAEVAGFCGEMGSRGDGAHELEKFRPTESQDASTGPET